MKQFIFRETERLPSPITTHNFYIDGFHRQANNTLRKLILDAFPTVSIEKKLEHTVVSFQEAFNSNKTVISTLRNPFDSFNSLCGYKNIDPLDVNQINLIIENYIYLHEYLYQNKNNILFIDFNDIIVNPIKILLYVKDKFSIKINNIEKYKELNTTPFYNQIREESFDDHNKTSSLEASEKLIWILQSENYIKAKEMYNKLFEIKIKLEDKL